MSGSPRAVEAEYVDPQVIRIDGGTQARAVLLDEAHVEDVKERYLAGEDLPPVVVFYDGQEYWCADGHHRVAAARAADFDEVNVDLREGSREEAALYSCGANQGHGLKRSPADKRAAARLCMKLRPSWSDRKVADHCGIDHKTVADERERAGGEIPQVTEREGRDGKRYTVRAPEPFVAGPLIEAITTHLKKYGALALRPIQLAMARSAADQALGRALSEEEWRALVEEGLGEGLWRTKSAIVGGRLIGEIWMPAQPRPEREAAGGETGSRTSPVEPASVASLSLSSMPPLWAARATRLVAKLDQGHGGSARLVELRHSSRESLGQLGEDGWETLLREGARAGLWVLEDDRIRLVRASSPSSDSEEAPRGRIEEALSALELLVCESGGRMGADNARACLWKLGPLTDEEWGAVLDLGAKTSRVVRDDVRGELVCERAPSDTDTDEDIEDAPEGPVLPSDPDDPAVQGHQAALEEGWRACLDCDGTGLFDTTEDPDDPENACPECDGKGGWPIDKDTESTAVAPEPRRESTAAPRASVSREGQNSAQPAAPTHTTTHAKGADAAQAAAAGADVSGAERPVAPTLDNADAVADASAIVVAVRVAAGKLGTKPSDLVDADAVWDAWEIEIGIESTPTNNRWLNERWCEALKVGKEKRWLLERGERIALLAGAPKPRPSAMPPDDLPAPPPVEDPVEAAEDAAHLRGLPPDQRAALDAYYTPDIHARACVRWLADHVYPGQDPLRILETSVGGGAWLRACRDQWERAHLRALDLDPKAAGLRLADEARVGDFLTLEDQLSADLIVGNPPYRGDLVAWIDRSRELAPVVGYLLRSTFLGAARRLDWWQRRPPSDVLVVLPRPAWEGPGARPTTDRVDSLFVVWRGAVAGSTRLHWLDAREGA